MISKYSPQGGVRTVLRRSLWGFATTWLPAFAWNLRENVCSICGFGKDRFDEESGFHVHPQQVVRAAVAAPEPSYPPLTEVNHAEQTSINCTFGCLPSLASNHATDETPSYYTEKAEKL